MRKEVFLVCIRTLQSNSPCMLRCTCTTSLPLFPVSTIPYRIPIMSGNYDQDGGGYGRHDGGGYGGRGGGGFGGRGFEYSLYFFILIFFES